MYFIPFRLIAFLLLICATSVHAAEPAYQVTHRELLPGDVKWDYLNFDAESKRLFITRGGKVDVYDTAKGRIVGSIEGTLGVHGVALVPELDRGFTSNGGSNTVSVFELSTLKILTTLPTEKKPDSIVFDPFTRRVFAANGESGSLTVIDAVKAEVITNVAIGGKLEYLAVNGKGRIYVNVEDKNKLVAVDTEKLTVLARHDLSASCNQPTGLSIDRAEERLFVGCRNQKLTVVSGLTGGILASVPIGKGSDATAYDSALHLAFSSNGEGSITVVSADTYAVTHTIVTQPTARTLALDSVSHTLYTVAADTEAPATIGGRPRLIPGTFSLLTISRQDLTGGL